jgi:hypothetical protein
VSPDQAAAARPLQLVTSGGGGAYLSATHHLFSRLSLTADRKPGARTFDRQAVYPSIAESRRRTAGCFALPFLSRSFAVLMAAVYLLLGWQLQISSRVDCAVNASPVRPPASAIIVGCWDQPRDINGNVAIRHLSLMDVLLEKPSLRDVAGWELRALLDAPLLTFEILMLGTLLYLFADGSGRRRRASLAVLHTLVHLVAVGAAVAFGAMVVGRVTQRAAAAGLYYGGWQQEATFAWSVAAFGALAGPLIFAAYLWQAAHFWTGAPHMNEVFSAGRCKDLKQFLRFHVDADGGITAFVIAVDRVVRRSHWRATETPAPSLYVPHPEPAWRIVDRFRL